MTLTAAALALAVGVAIGLFGGGGSLLLVPALTYVMGFETKQAVATSLAVVGISAAVGAVAARAKGSLPIRPAFIVGIATMAGAFGGAIAGARLDDAVQLTIFGVVALFDALPDVAVVIIMVATFVLLFALYIPLGLGRLVAGVSAGQLVALVIAILALVAAFVVPAALGFRAAFHSAIFVLVVQVAIVPLLAVRGVRRIRIGPPEETIASVKEDVEWAKSRLLRRG